MKQNRITGLLLTAVLSGIMLIQHGTVNASPYRLSPVREGILAGTGLSLYGFSLYNDRYIDTLTDNQIEGLSESNINSFDRSAADNWSPDAAEWSDRFLYTMLISPGVFLINDETRSDYITIGVMYAESLLITQGMNGTVKNIIQRKRPFTYNPDAPDEKKREKDAVRSFYSGHTSHAFNSAVFLSTVFTDYYPGSSLRFAVWGVSVSAAAFTGYLRYRAGKHYPSDIIAGAVIGSLTGYAIPAFHRADTGTFSIRLIPGETGFICAVFYL